MVRATKTSLRRCLVLLAIASGITASPAVAASGPELGAVCPSILRPVCAAKGAEQRTFSNRCMAERAGWRLLSEGNCGSEAGNRPRVCPKHHRPVCGERNGMRRSFGNSCEASAAAYRVVRQGACS